MSVEQDLVRDLGRWSALSVAVGGALAAAPAPAVVRGFGRQTAAWGAVNGAIAAVGARRGHLRGPTDPVRLRRVLLVNAGLDVGYTVAGGLVARRTRWRGDGLAAVVQGMALLVLDGTAARRLR